MTNKGLRIEPLLAGSPVLNFEPYNFLVELWLMLLNCGPRNKGDHLLAIILKQKPHGQFARVFSNRLIEIEMTKLHVISAKDYGYTFRDGCCKKELIYVRQQCNAVPSLREHFSFSVTSRPPLEYIISVGQFPMPYIESLWDYALGGCKLSGEQSKRGRESVYNRNGICNHATLVFTDQGVDVFVLLLIISTYRPVAKVLVPKNHSPSEGTDSPTMTVAMRELYRHKVSSLMCMNAVELEWGKSTSMVVGSGAERGKPQYTLDIFVGPADSDYRL
jgi:hypothetical protein